MTQGNVRDSKAGLAARVGTALAFFIALMGIGEIGIRTLGPPLWYVDEAPGQRERTFILVGNSLMAAVFDVETFIEKAWKAGRQEIEVMDCSRGYATMAGHYLGLRNLAERSRQGLKECTVVIQAPRGWPDEQSWKDPWAHLQRPDMMMPLMRPGDLKKLWLSETCFDAKCVLTTGCFLKGSRLWVSRLHLRDKILSVASGSIGRAIGSTGRPKEDGELSEAGGVRTDAEGMEYVGEMADKGLIDSLSDEKAGASASWEDCIVDDVVKLTHSAGGEVVFLAIPASSAFPPIPSEVDPSAKRAAFLRQNERWGTTLLDVSFPCRDEDFPDRVHLSKRKSREFTSMVYDAWKRALLRAD